MKWLVPAGRGRLASCSMGCPPDPVDVSIWRSGERIQSLQERYDALRHEYADAAKLAVAMEILSFEKADTWRGERFSTRTGVHPTENNQYADMEAQIELEQGYAKRVKALENALCELRTKILAGRAHVGGADKALFDKVYADHVRHREDDRRTALAWLKERREIMKWALDAKDEPHMVLNRPVAEGLLREINQRIASLSRVKMQRLLQERALTQIDEGRYVIPYK